MRTNCIVKYSKHIVKWMKDKNKTEYFRNYKFKPKEHFLYLGEINNMPGHGIFVAQDGKIFWGYHIDSFDEVQDDET